LTEERGSADEKGGERKRPCCHSAPGGGVRTREKVSMMLASFFLVETCNIGQGKRRRVGLEHSRLEEEDGDAQANELEREAA